MIEGVQLILGKNLSCDQVIGQGSGAIIVHVKISPDGFAFVPGVKDGIHEIEPRQSAEAKYDDPRGRSLSGLWAVTDGVALLEMNNLTFYQLIRSGRWFFQVFYLEDGFLHGLTPCTHANETLGT